MDYDVSDMMSGAADIIRECGLIISIAGGILIIILGAFSDIDWFIDPNILGLGIGFFGSVSVWMLSLLFRGFGALLRAIFDIKELLMHQCSDKNE